MRAREGLWNLRRAEGNRPRGKSFTPDLMDVTPTPLAGVLVLKPKRFMDARGFFSETYNRRDLAEAGIEVDFVQDNLSMSRQPGTLRGLHFQREPQAQAKLVGVSKGAVRDVVVDLRLSSPTFAKHFSVVLSSDEGNQIFIPSGFAHGFLTLEPDTLAELQGLATLLGGTRFRYPLR